jgi:hypothetical protein
MAGRGAWRGMAGRRPGERGWHWRERTRIAGERAGIAGERNRTTALGGVGGVVVVGMRAAGKQLSRTVCHVECG